MQKASQPQIWVWDYMSNTYEPRFWYLRQRILVVRAGGPLFHRRLVGPRGQGFHNGAEIF